MLQSRHTTHNTQSHTHTEYATVLQSLGGGGLDKSRRRRDRHTTSSRTLDWSGAVQVFQDLVIQWPLCHLLSDQPHTHRHTHRHTQSFYSILLPQSNSLLIVCSLNIKQHNNRPEDTKKHRRYLLCSATKQTPNIQTHTYPHTHTHTQKTEKHRLAVLKVSEEEDRKPLQGGK